jgi:SHS2 domain-containing protein
MECIEPWTNREMSGAYRELEHPADIFLEIRARDLPELFENALYAFYDHAVELSGISARRELLLEVWAPSNAEALRELLAEALFHLETQGFIGAAAAVEVDQAAPPDRRISTRRGEAAEAGRPLSLGTRVKARLIGEKADDTNRTFLAEIKAVTYHRLEATRADDGAWKATVLLDV